MKKPRSHRSSRSRRRSERFATNLRNEIQRKKAQLSKSKGPGGLLYGRDTVEEEEGPDLEDLQREEADDLNPPAQERCSQDGDTLSDASRSAPAPGSLSLLAFTSTPQLHQPSPPPVSALQPPRDEDPEPPENQVHASDPSRTTQKLDPAMPSCDVGIRVVEELAPAGMARRWRWTPEHNLQPEMDTDRQGERVRGALGVSGRERAASTSSSSSSTTTHSSRTEECDILPFADRCKFFEETSRSMSVSNLPGLTSRRQRPDRHGRQPHPSTLENQGGGYGQGQAQRSLPTGQHPSPPGQPDSTSGVPTMGLHTNRGKDYPQYRRDSCTRPPDCALTVTPDQYQHHPGGGGWSCRLSAFSMDDHTSSSSSSSQRSRAMLENNLCFDSTYCRASPSVATETPLSELEEGGGVGGVGGARGVVARKKTPPPPRPPPPKWEEFHRRRASHHTLSSSSTTSSVHPSVNPTSPPLPFTPPEGPPSHPSHTPCPTETSKMTRQRSYSVPPQREELEGCQRCSLSQLQERPFSQAPPSPGFTRRTFRPVAPHHRERDTPTRHNDSLPPLPPSDNTARLCNMDDQDRSAVLKPISHRQQRTGAEWERTPSPRMHSVSALPTIENGAISPESYFAMSYKQQQQNKSGSLDGEMEDQGMGTREGLMEELFPQSGEGEAGTESCRGAHRSSNLENNTDSLDRRSGASSSSSSSYSISAAKAQVESLVLAVCQPNEVDKFRMFIGDLDKVFSLLLSLSGRLLRVESSLDNLDAETGHHERLPLLEKKRQLQVQLSEAQDLKEHVDHREQAVGRVLMKAALLVEQRQLEEKIRLGEEQLRGLRESLGLGFKMSM
ncbi:unnamed protein product, partial [Coregonus sp. 'balchen']